MLLELNDRFERQLCGVVNWPASLNRVFFSNQPKRKYIRYDKSTLIQFQNFHFISFQCNQDLLSIFIIEQTNLIEFFTLYVFVTYSRPIFVALDSIENIPGYLSNLNTGMLTCRNYLIFAVDEHEPRSGNNLFDMMNQIDHFMKNFNPIKRVS